MRKILIIEDSPDDRAEIRRMLLAGSDTRYRFIEAETGAQGLRCCRSVEDGLPHVVLLDFHLPDMHAVDVLAQLCDGAELPPCPVIVLTGADSQSGPELLRAGAQDYLGKSWTTAESLTHAVENAIQRFALLTERKQAMEMVAQQARELNALYTTTPIGLFQVDADLRFVRVNAWMAAINGRSIAAHIGRTVGEVVHPSVVSHVERLLREVLRTGEALLEFEIHGTSAADGGARDWLASYYPVRDARGETVGVHGVVQDITEREHAEAALRQSEERFRSLAEAMPHCVWVTDNVGANIYKNQIWYDYTGTKPGSGPGDDWLDSYHPDDRSNLRQEWSEVLRADGARGYDIEVRIRRHDGEYRWFRIKGAPVKNADGETVRWGGTCSDIDDQRRAGEKLRSAYESFRHLMENSPFGIYTVDADFRFAQVSGGAQKTFENIHPLIGRDFGDVVRIQWPERFANEVIAIFRRVLETGEAYAASMVEARADIAAVESYEWKAERIILPDGRPGVVCHFYDLSERQIYEARLRESEERYRGLFHSLLEGYCLVEMIYDAAGGAVDYRFLEVNPAFEAQSGLNGAKGRTIREFSPDIESSWIEVFAKVAETGEPVRFEMVAAELNRCFDVQGYRVDEAGSKKVAIVFNDITERQTAQRALRDGEARVRLATEATAVGIWEWNVLTNTMHWDAQVFRIYGIAPTPDGLVHYSDWSGAVLPEDLLASEAILQDAVLRGRQSRREFRILRRNDGERRVIEAVETVRRNEQGESEWVVGTNLDITERRTSEERLRQMTADLSEADGRKDEFLATLAHELRNPLAPISNGLQLIKLAGGQPATVEKARTMMERQLTQMVRLIDDLMDVSRISRGKLELRKEQVALAAVVNSAVETSRPLIEQMGHQLTVTLPRQTPTVNADPTRLAQVFQNLLNNAAKYSERGGYIELKVESQGRDAVVAVKDTGVGIAADQLPLIFDMFTQVGGSLGMAQGGLGIGLTLVKRLVELHGGTVEATSEGPGKGSVFVVRLPLVIAPAKPQDPGDAAPPSVGPPLRILVVDDNRDSADSLSEILKMLGNDIHTAYDGQEGVDAAGDFRPDVILLDIGLPKLNGYEACRRIREQPWGKDVVMIAATGWGQRNDRLRANAAGFDHHLVKPVDPQALIDLLNAVNVGLASDKRRTHPTGTGASTPDP